MLPGKILQTQTCTLRLHPARDLPEHLQSQPEIKKTPGFIFQ